MLRSDIGRKFSAASDYFPGLRIAMILAFLKAKGTFLVLKISLKKFRSHSMVFGPEFLMNSGCMQSNPAAFPIFKIEIASVNSSIVNGWENSSLWDNFFLLHFSLFLIFDVHRLSMFTFVSWTNLDATLFADIDDFSLNFAFAAPRRRIVDQALRLECVKFMF